MTKMRNHKTVRRQATHGLLGTRHAASIGVLAVYLLSGCGISKFDDFSDSAPAVRVKPSGDTRATVFGQPLIGLEQTEDGEGGILFVGGSGGSQAVFNTVDFATSGEFSNNAPDLDELRDSDKLDIDGANLVSMAALVFGQAINGQPGPFAFIGVRQGGIGKAFLLDVRGFDRIGDVLRKNDSEERAENFGSAMTAARLGGAAIESGGSVDERRRDLVVGAVGGIWLFQSGDNPGSWATDQGGTDGQVVFDGVTADDDLPATSEVRALAAGNLNAASDQEEVVAGVPDKNYVGIVDDVPGARTLRALPLPENADRFGSALAIGNVDGGSDIELVVGAPNSYGGTGAVYVYRLSQAYFDGGMDPAYFDDADDTNRKVVEVRPPAAEGTDSVRGFGTALTIGAFDDSGAPLLAISASASSIGGTSNAGRVYIYDRDNLSDSETPPSNVVLASPQENDLLGSEMTTVPFRVGDVTHTLLAISAKESALTFFSSLTDDHPDVRRR